MAARWTVAALILARDMRQENPSVSRDDLIRLIKEAVSDAPDGRTISMKLTEWQSDGLLAPPPPTAAATRRVDV